MKFTKNLFISIMLLIFVIMDNANSQTEEKKDYNPPIELDHNFIYENQVICGYVKMPDGLPVGSLYVSIFADYRRNINWIVIGHFKMRQMGS